MKPIFRQLLSTACYQNSGCGREGFGLLRRLAEMNSWNLDRYRGIDPYVSLCLTRNHGMKFLAHQDGRLPNPRYLAINPEVLEIDGVRVALGVANANDVQIFPIAQAMDHLDVQVLYSRTDWKNPQVQARLRAAEKVEILVPNEVPRRLITGYF